MTLKEQLKLFGKDEYIFLCNNTQLEIYEEGEAIDLLNKSKYLNSNVIEIVVYESEIYIHIEKDK